MNWPLIRTTLQSAVVAMTGIAPALVVWRGTLAEKSIVVGTKIVLTANAIKSVGEEENLYEESAVPNQNELESTIVGQRQFTWSVQVETQNQPEGTARVLIDRIRIRLRRPSIGAMLGRASVAVAYALATTENDYLASGREISVATMDLLMNANDVDRDDTLGSGDWIGQVLIESDTIDEAPGEPFDPQIELDVDAREA